MYSGDAFIIKGVVDPVYLKEMKKDVSQDEIDKILDKISESGYASLSKKEKEKLFNASKK